MEIRIDLLAQPRRAVLGWATISFSDKSGKGVEKKGAGEVATMLRHSRACSLPQRKYKKRRLKPTHTDTQADSKSSPIHQHADKTKQGYVAAPAALWPRGFLSP